MFHFVCIHGCPPLQWLGKSDSWKFGVRGGGWNASASIEVTVFSYTYSAQNQTSKHFIFVRGLGAFRCVAVILCYNVITFFLILGVFCQFFYINLVFVIAITLSSLITIKSSLSQRRAGDHCID